MDENTKRMMEQLKADPAALRQLMQSRDGQALMQALTRPDNGAGLQRAMQSAMRGGYECHGGAGGPGGPKPGGRGFDGARQPAAPEIRREVRPHGGV